MGQSLSTEEELFRRGEFAEALVKSSEREAPESAGKSPPFIMTPVEWETVGTLCDNGSNGTIVRAAAAKIDLAASTDDPSASPPALYCPLVCCVAQLIAADAGVIPWDEARRRWESVSAVVTASDPSSHALPWLRPQHERLMELFDHSVSTDPADVRQVRRTLRELDDASEKSSAGFGSRPVVHLLLRYCAISLAMRAANHAASSAAAGAVEAQVDDASDHHQRRAEASKRSSFFLMAAIDEVHLATESVQQTVHVGFLEAAMERIQQRLLDADLMALAAQQETPGEAKGGSSRSVPTWNTLGSTFVGQEHAINTVRSVLRAKNEGLASAEKPTVLVFFGPSGHGKTELGRLVAAAQSGSAQPEETGDLVHIHMTSFCTRDSIYSLVDPPAAHVGEGMLLSALRKKPNAIVVLDEFEKSTADAVQNVWLSAFPKGGMLRSLKDASRSISTAQTTFILTCNTLADTIDSQREAYLHADASRREAMRTAWEGACREALRSQFGEPFTARIDSFVPFVPYDMQETRAYFHLQLDGVRRNQRARGRDIEVTEAFESFITAELSTRGFHGCRVEQILQPHLLRLADSAEGTYDNDNNGIVTPSNRIVLHAKPTVSGQPEITSFVGAAEVLSLGLPGSTALARRWSIEAASAPLVKATAEPSSVQDSSPSEPESEEPPVAREAVSATVASRSESDRAVVPTVGEVNVPAPASAAALASQTVHDQDDVPKQMMLETSLETKTEREKVLECELEKSRAKVVELQHEVETLKETVKQLQTALAVVLAALVATLCFLSLFVSLSTLVSFCAIAFAALQYFVGNAAFIMSVAVSGFVKLVGPAKAAAVAALLTGWLLWHGHSSLTSQCAPCPLSPESSVTV